MALVFGKRRHWKFFPPTRRKMKMFETNSKRHASQFEPIGKSCFLWIYVFYKKKWNEYGEWRIYGTFFDVGWTIAVNYLTNSLCFISFENPCRPKHNRFPWKWYRILFLIILKILLLCVLNFVHLFKQKFDIFWEEQVLTL